MGNGYPRIQVKGKVFYKHRYVWELYNGPIPIGKIIHHIDGNILNYNIENLELTTRKEHKKLHNRDNTLTDKVEYKTIMINNVVYIEHRYIMEQFIGRPLLPDEHIHHIDFNKRNNSIDNLVILTNSEHSRLHKQKYSESTKCEGCGKYYDNNFKKNKCLRCYARSRNQTTVKQVRNICSCGRDKSLNTEKCFICLTS